MKTILLASLLLLGASARAAEPSIQITSFVLFDSRLPIGELCGRITGIEQGYAVAKVVADYDTNRPGVSHLLVGTDGRFCTTITTYYRTAQASVELLGRTLTVTAQPTAATTR